MRDLNQSKILMVKRHASVDPSLRRRASTPLTRALPLFSDAQTERNQKRSSGHRQTRKLAPHAAESQHKKRTAATCRQ
jgi:hypothetical protein